MTQTQCVNNFSNKKYHNKQKRTPKRYLTGKCQYIPRPFINSSGAVSAACSILEQIIAGIMVHLRLFTHH